MSQRTDFEVIKILHVDTGKEWRGGQRQVFLLHRGLLSREQGSLVVAQAQGALYQKLPGLKIPFTCRGEWDIVAVYTLARLIRRFSPDIIHAHDAHAHTLLLLASLFGKKRPLVVSRRVDFPIARSCLSRWKYRTSRISKIIAVSNGIKEVLIRDRISEEKIVVIHSGIELKEISRNKGSDIRRQLSIPDEARVLGCIANFAGHKDHRTLLQVFHSLAEVRKDVYLLLVGDGPLYEEIKAESRRMTGADRVIFTGYQEDIYPYLLSFDIFVLTSYLEGLCSSLIDSLMFGVPIVASRTGGIPEVVQDGQNGFLVEVGDISGFAAKIITLLEDTEMYTAFQKQCLLSVRQFSIEKTVAETLSVYQQLIRGH